MMVRWCLLLRHQSSKAYSTLRQSGIALPSERDYTHYCKVQTGFSAEVDRQLSLASKVTTCEAWKKYVIILVDEMYIRYMMVQDCTSKLSCIHTSLVPRPLPPFNVAR